MGWFDENAQSQVSAPTAGIAPGPGSADPNRLYYGGGHGEGGGASSMNVPDIPPDIQQKVTDYIQSQGLTANQSDPASLEKVVRYLQSQGVNAQVDDTDVNGHTGGIVVNGKSYQMIDGSNRWTKLQPWEGGSGGAQGGSPSDIMAQDPGYQFRLDEGAKALQRSAAARGTLLTGGTQKALARYGQDYASGEFGSIFNRNLQLANLGANAAAGQANTTSQLGNAQGASQIAQGNAYSGAVNGLTSLGSFYAMNRTNQSPLPVPNAYGTNVEGNSLEG